MLIVHKIHHFQDIHFHTHSTKKVFSEQGVLILRIWGGTTDIKKVLDSLVLKAGLILSRFISQ